jgi:hypothetical protein
MSDELPHFVMPPNRTVPHLPDREFRLTIFDPQRNEKFYISAQTVLDLLRNKEAGEEAVRLSDARADAAQERVRRLMAALADEVTR